MVSLIIRKPQNEVYGVGSRECFPFHPIYCFQSEQLRGLWRFGELRMGTNRYHHYKIWRRKLSPSVV